MTVAELITALAKLPAGMPVYVRGHERGVNDVEFLHLGFFVRDVSDEPRAGQHAESQRVVLSGVPGVELRGRNMICPDLDCD